MFDANRLLTVKNLYVKYKSYWYIYHVLNDISINVGLGEKIGIIGESGAGKTTLLKSILQVLPINGKITSGEIFYRDVNLLKCSKQILLEIRRKRVGMIFQDPLAALNPVFTIKDHLLEVLRYANETANIDKSDLINIALDLLRDTLIPDPERILNSYPFQLSGGMRQRIVIAMALASARELLLADEPTTNLDVTIQAQILKLIGELVEKRGLSMILISHALGLIRKMTERVYVMYGGNIIEEAPTFKLFNEPLHPYTQLLFKTAPKILEPLSSVELRGNPLDYRNLPNGCVFHPRCPYGDSEVCRKVKPHQVKVEKDRTVYCHIYGS